MADGDPLQISPALAIPREELLFRASRSGGPGGQHVNTSSTRIEVVWNVLTSPALSDEQRAALLRRLATRLDSQGQIRIVSQAGRSQLQNREAAVERLIELVAAALIEPKKRKATKPTKASKVRRVEAKKKRGELKRDRRQKGDDR
ncbi:MAG: alternative ribosome rescue aminoacyl-tRNA hydrolase ArfB [Gemmatimonadales bacterium]|nr:alternative ribosome rescue aminoacyl-tRNA hydrolase ArfB [Gemmatimonadales bacterium]